MNKIIAATDFSIAGTNAAKYAAEMALAVQGELFLYHVILIPVTYSEIPVSMNFDEYISDAQTALDTLKNDLVAGTGRHLRITTRVDIGVFFQELNSRCTQIKPYAVVLGSQGKTAAERVIFGSESLYAIKHLAWPLVTVPPEATFKGVERLGLACDLSEADENASYEEIQTLVQDFGATLHVVNTGKKLYDEEWEEYQRSAFGKTLSTLGAIYHDVYLGDPDEAIIDFATANKLDLLVLMPKRYGVFEALLHRNEAKPLILHSTVPVMVLHE